MRKLPQLVMVLPLIASLDLAAQKVTIVEDLATRNIIISENTPFSTPFNEKLNMEGIAEAYPFLSADGLRLYFTSNREGGHGRFFISTRKTLNEPFGKPQVLSIHLTDGYFAGSLTADELTICMVRSGKVYISKRKDLVSEFGLPVELTGFPDGFLCGPSISPDGSEIIITISSKEGYSTRIFKQRNGSEYYETGKLDVPEGLVIGPGQLSKDGLSYYFSFGNTLNYNASLWRYTRASLRSDFTQLEELPAEINRYHRNLQPSFNADGSVMAYVSAETNAWKDDEIQVISLKPQVYLDNPPLLATEPVKEIVEPVKEVVTPSKEIVKTKDNVAAKKPVTEARVSVKAYPNPVYRQVILEMDQQPGTGTLFILYDLNGRIVIQRTISAKITKIEMEALTPSGYIYNVISNKNESIATGKLIKN